MSGTQRRPSTVLVVEDDGDVRAILSELLRADGFVVIEAGNGREALDAAREARPHVIVLDVMMPVLDGLGFLAERADDAALAATPVVLVSAVVDSLDLSGLAVDAVLAKPVELDRLTAVLRQLVGTPAGGARRAFSETG